MVSRAVEFVGGGHIIRRRQAAHARNCWLSAGVGRPQAQAYVQTLGSNVRPGPTLARGWHLTLAGVVCGGWGRTARGLSARRCGVPCGVGTRKRSLRTLSRNEAATHAASSDGLARSGRSAPSAGAASLIGRETLQHCGGAAGTRWD
jgi:hypothetical protein